ncbi:MAG: ATP-dependent Clp protease adaptor ClpS [Candidatus Kapabacteria bacterium]|nr:ATP-dependent Clp protease adaptor ClpS [Candidatus Kapabacteria bacterium]
MIEDIAIKLQSTETLEEPIIDELSGITTTFPVRVILFNDDWHSFDEVVSQIIKAINCSTQHANNLMLEAHKNGKVCVFEGEIAECLAVSSVLEEIALHTQIEY